MSAVVCWSHLDHKCVFHSLYSSHPLFLENTVEASLCLTEQHRHQPAGCRANSPVRQTVMDKQRLSACRLVEVQSYSCFLLLRFEKVFFQLVNDRSSCLLLKDKQPTI